MLAITPRTRYMTYSNSLKVTNISYRSHTFRAILWENLLLSSGGKCLTRYCLDNSFTDLPQHVILISQFLSLPWCALTGSNRRHLACKTSTLPAELSAHIKLEAQVGVEPTNAGFAGPLPADESPSLGTRCRNRTRILWSVATCSRPLD